MKEFKELSTQDVLQRCLALLLGDARMVLGDPDFMLGAENVDRYRLDDTNYLCHPKRFKYRYQVNNLFKRFIRDDEIGKEDLLEKSTLQKFVGAQYRINEFIQRPLPVRTMKVLQTARKFIKQVLNKGPYSSPEEYRWGKRAAVGVPYRESYLDSRVDILSGSAAHIHWFRDFTGSDELLSGSLLNGEYRYVSQLAAGFVPKSWKALRLILKNSNIGGFHSAGVGSTMVKLWREYGYDLYARSVVHGSVIAQYSIDRSHVTADLTSASDLYCTTILRWLLPYEWFKAVMLGHVPYVVLEGENASRILTVMTMGVGYTFPLQSLCFYSILIAIRNLSGSDGLISVFGDDLIYPSSMHPIVKGVFSDLNFVLNEDKTFVKEEFRESCGRDYYCGRDVRPFMPEGVCERLSGVELRVYLHKTLNGFRRRWNSWEIPSVVSYLESLLYTHFGPIFQVPGDYPDTAGVKVPIPIVEKMYNQPSIDKNGSFSFECLGGTLPNRVVKQARIYYWEYLRTRTGPQVHIDSPFDKEEDKPVLKYVLSRESKALRKKFLREAYSIPREYTRVKAKRFISNNPNELQLDMYPLLEFLPPLEYVPCVSRKGLTPKYINQKRVTPHWTHRLVTD